MKTFKISTIIVLTLTGLLFGSRSYGTDGYFSHGYGTPYKSMAGAGIALYRTSLLTATNPPGLVFLGSRYEWEIELSFSF